MKKKNLIRCALVALIGLLCTGALVSGVYSAANNALGVSDKVEFVADSYVDAKVEIYINTTLDKTIKFSDVLNSDDEQTATISKVEGDAWLDNTETTDNEIDKIATVKFVITNTSDYRKLDASISRTGSGENCVIVEPTVKTSSDMEKGGSATFIFQFKVDGRLDVKEFLNTYSIILESHK